MMIAPIASPLPRTTLSPHEAECLDLLRGAVDTLDADADADVLGILAAAMGFAPYLDRLYRDNLTLLPRLIAGDGAAVIADAEATLRTALDTATKAEQVMRAIRQFRQALNMAVTSADLLNLAPIEMQLQWLSHGADSACALLADWLERQARQRGRLRDNARWFILAMGKLGAGELNFSSDIDLIVLYDSDADDAESGRVFVDMAREFTQIMGRPTAHGIGWRVDFRLRPNPSVTAVAMRVDNAMSYYEALARTWERVAFIRARVIAGDRDAGAAFLDEIEVFIWRRYLDYAVLDDMKLMLQREPKTPELYGYNVKKGAGGIRAIEFAVHVQQLIAGGREQSLRASSTITALNALAQQHWISTESAALLTHHYYVLRRLEHRIQMLHDAHNHQLPRNAHGFAQLARFCGHDDSDQFRTAIHALTDAVIENTANVASKLGTRGGSADAPTTHLPVTLFLDQDDDNEAVMDALNALGFVEVAGIADTCRKWLAGQLPATQSDRARTILNRILPELLHQISKADNPDQAFHAFVRLVEGLPMGVQFFSLLESNPNLAKVIATIIIAAPRMADTLSDHAELMDDLLYEDFWQAIDSDIAHLTQELSTEFSGALNAHSHEASLDALRVVLRQWRFRAQVHMVTGLLDPLDAGGVLSAIASAAIAASLPLARARIEARYGHLEGGALAVLALGRLGAGEMTSASDLDLVFIHQAPEWSSTDGAKSIPSSLYFTRIGQELINILTAPTSQGHGYEVDMRLRPSGKSGPVTIDLDHFSIYQMENAWTWEHMALIRGAVITGFAHGDLEKKLETCLAKIMKIPRDAGQAIADASEMRGRIAKHHPPRSKHDLRLIPGGLIDLDFFTQVMQLIHPLKDGTRIGQASAAIKSLANRNIISKKDARILIESAQIFTRLNQMMRLTMTQIHEQKATALLPQPLMERFGIADVEALDALVAAHADTVKTITAKYLR